MVPADRDRQTGVASGVLSPMSDDGDVRAVLDAVAAGKLSPAVAEAELLGHVGTDAGRFDAAREGRTGVPEAVLAAGKTPEETADLAATAVETTGRAVVTRVDDDARAAIRERLATDHPDATVESDDRTGVVVAHAADYEPPELDATVGVVTAGTADAVPAGEAAAIVRETGAAVEVIEDVGVAGIARLFDHLDDVRSCDVVIVAAGREGALPTVVAGLVAAPVIGLPVSTGYGHGGEGEAALGSMLQSCAPLAVVNVDAGFAAGAHAAAIARAIDDARPMDDA